MEAWRIVFMGTPDFAVPSLQSLIRGDDPVVGIFTQPDKPSGRGMKFRSPPVKEAVVDLAIPVFQPARLRDLAAVAEMAALQPDLVVVVAYGQILPEKVLAIPRHGCINVHASLLPRWRGAAPLHRALLAADSRTGVTIMKMDAGLDTGPILSKREFGLNSALTGGQLHDELARLGAELLVDTLPGYKSGAIQPCPQPLLGVTYADKLTRKDESIDWRQGHETIQRQILALHPWPAASTTLVGKLIKVFGCRIGAAAHGVPGEIVQIHHDGLEVACGQGSLVLTELQVSGKRRMLASDWLRGNQVEMGMLLD